MQQSLFTYDITEISKVSNIIIDSIKQNNKVLFSGPIGSGKTTLCAKISSYILDNLLSQMKNINYQ